jgi:hypothetical protein
MGDSNSPAVKSPEGTDWAARLEAASTEELEHLLANSTAPSADSNAMDVVAKEELGRQVLSHVGADPFADEVWVWLINDPELSPKVREDLIEDLNENGFSDGNGRRPTVDDLPLIESRIMLIEEHSPFAIDEVNAAAFAEAYKDLVEMWWRLNE